MHNGKLLIGNSGDKVYVTDDLVIKKAGVHKDKFKQQIHFLLTCNHPNFIDIKRISDEEYHMHKHPTFYDFICNNDLNESLYRLEELLDIVDGFQSVGADVKTRTYLDKLESRTGYKYEGEFDAASSFGFVHGDLTISNILYDDRFIFIDPRGTEEQDYYDYGKLMQSFTMNYEAHIYNEWNPTYLEFCKEAEKIMYERYDPYQLKFFLAVHLLGAVPFFELNERYEMAKLFLEKGHSLFDELGIKYTK